MSEEPKAKPTVKQVIVLRTTYPDGKGGTFKPRLGKMVAQGAHASMKVFFDRRHGQGGKPGALVVPLDDPMREWVVGTFTKVVLGVDTEEELLRVHAEANARGLPTALVTDVGATEFHGVPTHTAVAVGPAPAELIDVVTGPGGVVKTRLL